jgi:hypothetical protein
VETLLEILGNTGIKQSEKKCIDNKNDQYGQEETDTVKNNHLFPKIFTAWVFAPDPFR